MTYLLDAFNVVHADARWYELFDGSGFRALKDELIVRLARFALDAQVDVVAVFDGSAKAGHRPRQERPAGVPGCARLAFLYSDPQERADRAIVEYVEAARRPGEITVVSDDKFVLRGARAGGAHTLASRAFLKRMREARRKAKDPLDGMDPRKLHGISEREVQEWRAYFGFGEDE